jgi:hypothetical protein
MPGRIIRKDPHRISGWAVHPRRLDYPVTLNVFLRAKLITSVLVPVNGTEWSSSAETPTGMFVVEVAHHDISNADLENLSLIIGETDERLDDISDVDQSVTRQTHVLTLDDILAIPLKRAWVVGETYRDALERGFPEGEVLELLYRDILGRPADESGHQTYMSLLASKRISFDEIRAALLASNEFKSRLINTTNAPGPIFSRKLLYLSIPSE